MAGEAIVEGTRRSTPGATRRAWRPWAALVLVTAGALVPLTMMLHGSLVLDIDYHAWTWPAIPAAWAPAAAGALLARRRVATGAILLGVASAAGTAVFLRELGWLTFGAAWLLAAWLYLDAGRAAGLLGAAGADERYPADTTGAG